MRKEWTTGDPDIQYLLSRGVQWLNGRVLNLGLRGRWFKPRSSEVTILSVGAQWLSGRVLDWRLRVVGSSLAGVTMLCP